MSRKVLRLAVAAAALTASVTAATAQQRRPQREEPSAHGGSLTEGIDCSACHTADGWRMGGGSGSGGFDHARTGFPLAGRHRTVGCTTCHAPGRQPRRACTSCHADNHQGRLGRDCDSCHSDRGWQHVRAIAMHRRTRLPLTGMHALLDCTECHVRTGERQWSSVPSDCFACHEGDYRRSDVHPSHLGLSSTAAFPRDCAQCHRASGWSPAVIDPGALPRSAGLVAPEDHDLRFPISHGPHRGTECAACHASPAVPSAVRCTGCHAHNPVRLRMQHTSVAASVQGPACLSCHPGGAAR